MTIFGYDIRMYFLLFMIYAILGWLMEVTCKLIQYKRFINRGFLIGPYCPIYGYGALLITILLHKYTNDPIVLFIMAIVVCGTLEYLTSYFMEKARRGGSTGRPRCSSRPCHSPSKSSRGCTPPVSRQLFAAAAWWAAEKR